MSRRSLRSKPRVCYYEPEEPNLDEYVFCEKCSDYVYEYCAIHGALLVVPDDKVPAKPNFPSFVPRAALTIPHVFLHLNYSTIPGAGVGVFSTLALPKRVRFGPYRGEITTEIISDYSWQIYGPDSKPSHVIDASDGNKSNWMRYVNCSRNWREQNLVAFQYQGQLYYRTIKTIPRFTELMVFYGSEFANKLGIDLGNYNSPKSYAQKFGAPVAKKRKIKDENKNSPAEKHNKEPAGQDINNPENNNKKSINQPVHKESDSLVKTEAKISLDKELNKDVIVPEKLTNAKDLEALKTGCTTNTNKSSTKSNFKKVHLADVDILNDYDIDKENISPHNKDNVSKTQISKQNANQLIKKYLYFVCDVCKYQHVCKSTLEKHMRFHDVNRKYSCDTCGYRFSKKYELIRHCHSHKVGTLSVKSNFCNDATITKILLKRQESVSKDGGLKSHSCNICGNILLSAHSLKRHSRIHIGEKPHPCTICQHKCLTSGELKIHLRRHTGEKRYQCNICQHNFMTSYKLKIHLRCHTGEKPYSCNICQHSFVTSYQLKIHLRCHTGEKPYSCNICQHRFVTSYKLKIHLRCHTGEKPYSCNICQYRFVTSYKLKIHLRCHTGEKPYSCNICQHSFVTSYQLKIHLRCHTGEKPYSCNICQHRFVTSYQLKIHLRYHTGEKPYPCYICQSKFVTQRELKIHFRRHTGEKPYPCNVCQKKFVTSTAFKRHNRIHTGEKPYSCHFCEHKFGQLNCLKRHLKSHVTQKQ